MYLLSLFIFLSRAIGLRGELTSFKTVLAIILTFHTLYWNFFDDDCFKYYNFLQTDASKIIVYYCFFTNFLEISKILSQYESKEINIL